MRLPSEDRVEWHEYAVQRLKGLAAAFCGVMTAFHLALDFIRK